MPILFNNAGCNMKKLVMSFLISSFFISLCFAETEGEKLFRTNKPDQACIQLEKEILDGSASLEAYNYLGLAYMQTGNFTRAVETFEKGMKVTGTDKKILSFNEGNAYYALGNFDQAIRCYALTLHVDPDFTKALLNKANANLMAQKYDDCIEDYELFLVKEPNDPQRPQIEEILALLRKHKQEMAEAEQRAREEEERRQKEEERLAQELERQRIEQERFEEEARLAEEERRRKLLEDVANSLQNTDSTNMSSGAEDLIEYDTEPELD